MPVAFLVPVDEDITGLEYSIRGDDGFRSVLTVVARLLVNGAVVQSQWEEALLRAARVQGKLGRLRCNRNKQWLYRFDIHKEDKETSGADVGFAIHHRRSRPQANPAAVLLNQAVMRV